MSNASPSSDHRWEGITAHDHARLHTGHVYNNQVNNIHNYAPDETNPAATQSDTEREWRADLLGWLMFAEIDDRREQVHQAHHDTFRWIFEDGHESGFVEWLSSGDGIFWINGKPASGKSTLMKFITQEERLRELLDIWTGFNPMVVASFYFWVAGSPLQRSLIGLYRTLLHQMLKAEEHMCHIAFPNWQRKFRDTEPTLGMLTAAVSKILASGRLSNKFFFIIDGLDEYDRDSIGKTQLAELMMDLTRTSRVKILLSSRPETPFKTAFQQCPTLRLESLTESDISAYINQRLCSNASTMNISDVDANSIKEIERFILDNAQGVFLWVVLTLNIALDGISNQEDLVIVRDRIMHLPPELEDLFTHILTKRIRQHHKQEAFRCLFITFVWHSKSVQLPEMTNLSYMVVSIARQASTYADACTLVRASSFESAQYFRNRLASRCQGLLETSGVSDAYSGVTFLHRTLLDYLEEDQGAQDLLQAELDDTFDVYTATMAGLIRARKLNVYEARVGIRIFFYFNMLAERSTGQSRSKLLFIFDRVESSLYVSDLRHWSNDYLDIRPPTKCNLLICAVHCGAALFVQESIEKGVVPDARTSSRLLYYALTPIFSAKQTCENWLIEPNLAVSALLLDHGADPADDDEELCPWLLVLYFVVKTAPSAIGVVRLPQDGSDRLPVALQLLAKFARNAPDLRECSALTIKEYTASGAIRELVLGRRCCRLDRPVQYCQCREARSWTLMGTEVLRLIESTEIDTTVGRKVSKVRRMVDLKRFFLPNQWGHN